jgi:hypothetical protein
LKIVYANLSKHQPHPPARGPQGWYKVEKFFRMDEEPFLAMQNYNTFDAIKAGSFCSMEKAFP